MSVNSLNFNLHSNSHFPGRSGLVGTRISLFYYTSIIGAKGDGDGGNNWSYKTCKAPVKLSPPTNQHPVFYRPDALPVTQPTMSKALKGNALSVNYLLCFN